MDYSELQVQIFTDAETRKAFCENPKEFLSNNGIEVPENVTLPESISTEDMENHISSLEERLNQRGLKFGRQLFNDIRSKPQLRTDLFKGISIKPDHGMGGDLGVDLGQMEGRMEDLKDRAGTNQTAAFVVAAVVYVTVTTWSYSTV